jgi:hypothetical protein
MILSTHGVIASQIQSYAFLLDTYTSAAAAYSLRKLRSAYTGSAIRVRRSSDNTETNIGFSSLFGLDTTSLSSFCSGTNGFVTTWYDQSGNGRNATQTTAANQPQIVVSGSVIIENGKPAVKFDGISSRLNGGVLLVNNTWSFFTSIKIDSMATAWNLIGQHSGTANTGRLQTIANDVPSSKIRTFFNNGASFSGLYSNTVSNNQYSITSLANNNDYFISINGAIEEVISNQALTPEDTNFTIGSIGLTLQPFNGKIQEIIGYTSNQSSNRTGIETNINSFYSIY